jgi:hypothetical protein
MDNMKPANARRRGAPPAGLSMPAEDNVSDAPAPIARAPMRPEMREESSAERAKRRAAELRGHIETIGDDVDEFSLPDAPEGWTYQWNRRLLLGKEDPSHMVELEQGGWEPVPVRRHPEYMPNGWQGATIERKGMILMERPTEIVEEVRRQHDHLARKQVRDKEAQIAGTPDGTMTRDHAKVRPQIKKGYEAIPIPKE